MAYAKEYSASTFSLNKSLLGLPLPSIVIYLKVGILILLGILFGK
jgi:hypothetical protein